MKQTRILLVDGNSAWGALSLLRSGSDFREEEVRAVAAIGQSFAVSLRRSLLHAAVERPDSLDAPPGVIVCERGRGRVLDVSAEARALIDEPEITRYFAGPGIEAPGARQIARELVTLPTHSRITRQTARRISELLMEEC